MSEADLLDGVLGELSSLPATTNPYQFLRMRIVDSATANLRTHHYVRPVLYVVAVVYGLLSLAIIAAIVVRLRRKTFWLYRREDIPNGHIYCPNGSTLFAIFFLVFYLVGEIYVPLFVTAVQNAIDYNLRPYLMAPLLLMAYLPLYAAAWCDMAGLAASAFVAHCRLSRSYGTRCPPWLVHAILFLPPLIACSYLVIVFALMGVQLRLEADAWQAVDAALAIDEAAWRPETSLLAVFGTLAELQEPAATLGEQYDASVTYMRIVLGSLAGNLLVICAVWLPAAVFGLVKLMKQLRVLRSEQSAATLVSRSPPLESPSTMEKKTFFTFRSSPSPPRDVAAELARRGRLLVRLCWIRSAGVLGFIFICVYTIYFGLSYAVDPSFVDPSHNEFIGWLLGFHGVQLLTTGPANIAFVIRSFQEDRDATMTSLTTLRVDFDVTPGIEEKEVGLGELPVLARVAAG